MSTQKSNLEEDIYGIEGEDFEVDVNDPIYQEALESEEPKFSDPKFSKSLMDIRLGKLSDKVEERLIQTYREKKRYRIIWWNIKNFLWLNGKIGNRWAFAATSIVLLLIISARAYYQYKNIKPDLASKQTPIIKPNPSSSLTAISNPEGTPINIPSIAENNEPNIDNVKKQNNQSNSTKNRKQPNKTNSSKSNPLNKKIDDNQIVHNPKPKGFTTVEDASRDVLRGVIVDFSLLEINQFYVGSFGDEEENNLLRQALIENLKSTDFVVLTLGQVLSSNNYGKIIKKINTIEIINPNTNTVLWYKSIKGNTGSPKEIAQSIVEALLGDIKRQQK